MSQIKHRRRVMKFIFTILSASLSARKPGICEDSNENSLHSCQPNLKLRVYCSVWTGDRPWPLEIIR